MKSSRLSTGNPAKAWVLVDQDNPFLETQCLGIIEAMGLPALLYRISLPWMWKSVPLWLIPSLLSKIQATPRPFLAPWPSFVICGGKIASKVGAYLKRKHNSFSVSFENASSFHKVIIESYYQGEKNNKIMTFGPLPRVHSESLLTARQGIYRKIDHLPKPRLGLFLEGNESLLSLIEILNYLYKNESFSLMIYGRYLSDEALQQLASGFKDVPHLLWHNQGDDPYLGFLAHSEVIITSNNSSLMMAEASSVGKPLFLYPASALDLYAKALLQKGYAHLLTKEVDLSSRKIVPPLQETQRVARILKEAYEQALGIS